MATKAVYDRCIRFNRNGGWREFHTGSFKPDLKSFFGKKELVDKREFERCSESEKRRHLEQDRVLIACYIEHVASAGSKTLATRSRLAAKKGMDRINVRYDMNRKKSRHPQCRRNTSRPILEASSTANEQLQLYVTHALHEMIPLCSRKDIHHHRSIALRIGDCCISVEVSVTPWETPPEASEFLERM